MFYFIVIKMNSKPLTEFESLKKDIEKNVYIPNLEQVLEELNASFLAASEDFRLSSPEEQEQNNDQYLQLQYLYHELGMVIITRLLDSVVINEQPTIERPIEPFPEQAEAMEEQPSELLRKDDQPPVNVALNIDDDEVAITECSETSMASAVFDPNASIAHETESTCVDKNCVSSNEQTLPPPPYREYREIMEPIFSLKQIRNVNEQTINLVLVTITEAAKDARDKGYSIKHDATLIIACVHRQLDEVSRALWTWQTENQEPSLDQFIGFLIKRAKRISPSELTTSNPRARTNSPIPSTSRAVLDTACATVPYTGTIPKQRAVASTSRENPYDLVFGTSAKKQKTVCPRCEADHFLHRCPQFKTLTLRAKLATIDKAKLCHNCFAASHVTAQCKKGDCKRCGVKHNSIICPKSENDNWSN